MYNIKNNKNFDLVYKILKNSDSFLKTIKHYNYLEPTIINVIETSSDLEAIATSDVLEHILSDSDKIEIFKFDSISYNNDEEYLGLLSFKIIVSNIINNDVFFEKQCLKKNYLSNTIFNTQKALSFEDNYLKNLHNIHPFKMAQNVIDSIDNIIQVIIHTNKKNKQRHLIIPIPNLFDRYIFNTLLILIEKSKKISTNEQPVLWFIINKTDKQLSIYVKLLFTMLSDTNLYNITIPNPNLKEISLFLQNNYFFPYDIAEHYSTNILLKLQSTSVFNFIHYAKIIESVINIKIIEENNKISQSEYHLNSEQVLCYLIKYFDNLQYQNYIIFYDKYKDKFNFDLYTNNLLEICYIQCSYFMFNDNLSNNIKYYYDNYNNNDDYHYYRLLALFYLCTQKGKQDLLSIFFDKIKVNALQKNNEALLLPIICILQNSYTTDNINRYLEIETILSNINFTNQLINTEIIIKELANILKIYLTNKTILYKQDQIERCQNILIESTKWLYAIPLASFYPQFIFNLYATHINIAKNNLPIYYANLCSHIFDIMLRDNEIRNYAVSFAIKNKCEDSLNLISESYQISLYNKDIYSEWRSLRKMIEILFFGNIFNPKHKQLINDILKINKLINNDNYTIHSEFENLRYKICFERNNIDIDINNIKKIIKKAPKNMNIALFADSPIYFWLLLNELNYIYIDKNKFKSVNLDKFKILEISNEIFAHFHSNYFEYVFTKMIVDIITNDNIDYVQHLEKISLSIEIDVSSNLFYGAVFSSFYHSYGKEFFCDKELIFCDLIFENIISSFIRSCLFGWKSTKNRYKFLTSPFTQLILIPLQRHLIIDKLIYFKNITKYLYNINNIEELSLAISYAFSLSFNPLSLITHYKNSQLNEELSWHWITMQANQNFTFNAIWNTKNYWKINRGKGKHNVLFDFPNDIDNNITTDNEIWKIYQNNNKVFLHNNLNTFRIMLIFPKNYDCRNTLYLIANAYDSSNFLTAFSIIYEKLLLQKQYQKIENNFHASILEKTHNLIELLETLEKEKTNLTKANIKLSEMNEVKTKMLEAQAQIEKMESLAALSIGIGHEISNPLQIILMLIEELEILEENSQDVQIIISKIKENIERIEYSLKQLKQLREYSKNNKTNIYSIEDILIEIKNKIFIKKI